MQCLVPPECIFIYDRNCSVSQSYSSSAYTLAIRAPASIKIRNPRKKAKLDFRVYNYRFEYNILTQIIITL